MPAEGKRARDDDEAPSSDYSTAVSAAGAAFAAVCVVGRCVNTDDKGLHDAGRKFKKTCLEIYNYFVGGAQDGDTSTEAGAGENANGDTSTEAGAGGNADGDTSTEAGAGGNADGDTCTESEVEGNEDERCAILGERMCSMCCNKKVDSVFIPCGHVNSCLDCSRKCLESTGGRCPICKIYAASNKLRL